MGCLKLRRNKCKGKAPRYLSPPNVSPMHTQARLGSARLLPHIITINFLPQVACWLTSFFTIICGEEESRRSTSSSLLSLLTLPPAAVSELRLLLSLQAASTKTKHVDREENTAQVKTHTDCKCVLSNAKRDAVFSQLALPRIRSCIQLFFF